MPKPDLAVEKEATEIIEQIGRRVAELRREAGWSQKRFSDILNASVQWVSLVENGRQNLTIHTMVRIANKLGVEVIELWQPPRAPPKTVKKTRGRPRRSS